MKDIYFVISWVLAILATWSGSKYGETAAVFLIIFALITFVKAIRAKEHQKLDKKKVSWLLLSACAVLIGMYVSITNPNTPGKMLAIPLGFAGFCLMASSFRETTRERLLVLWIISFTIASLYNLQAWWLVAIAFVVWFLTRKRESDEHHEEIEPIIQIK